MAAGGGETGAVSLGSAGATASSATDDVGVDGTAGSTGIMGRSGGSLRISAGAMFLFNGSSRRGSSATGVSCVVEGICGEIGGCGCAMGIGGGVVDGGFGSLDSPAV